MAINLPSPLRGALFSMKHKNYLQLLKEAHQRHPGDFSYTEGKKKFNAFKNANKKAKYDIIRDEVNPHIYGKEKNNK